MMDIEAAQSTSIQEDGERIRIYLCGGRNTVSTLLIEN